MNEDTLKETIKRELPGWLRTDPEFRAFVLGLTRTAYADRAETHDRYIFERKARFYERRQGRKADRLIVISPMIDAKARHVAEELGIETYGDSTDVESL